MVLFEWGSDRVGYCLSGVRLEQGNVRVGFG